MTISSRCGPRGVKARPLLRSIEPARSDHLAFTAAGASLSGSRAYDPWGNVTATIGTVTGHMGYQSARTDAAGGKDLMGARWYDPGWSPRNAASRSRRSGIPYSARLAGPS